MDFVKSMFGLGDNIYQRAFVKRLGDVVIDTPWPELYEDLPVQFARSITNLRSQVKNIQAQKREYVKWDKSGKAYNVRYLGAGIVQGMRRGYGFEPAEFDLPDYGPPLIEGEYALIRPATVRKEWRADTRNPNPDYLCEAAEELRAAGIKVISVADLEDRKEWLVGDMPYHDKAYHKGQLSVKQLMALTKNAALVVGGVGWIVPACIAYKTPAWIVCGGQGGYNHPDMITDPCMDLSNIYFAIPDNMCKCTRKEHNCDKTITGHREQFRAYLASRGWDRLSPGTAD